MSRQDNSQTHPNFHAPIEVGRRPFAVEAGESRGLGGSGAGRAAAGHRLRRGNERRRADGACRSAPRERGAGGPFYGFRL